MDLRYEFEQILAQYGYPVLVVRQDRKLRCSCWNEKKQEADRECPFCFGLGFTVLVEKHTVRDADASIPQTLPLIEMNGQFGGLTVPTRYYFMKHDIQLGVQDLLLDVDWTPQGKPLYTGRGIYEVSHIDPQRFERGAIVFNKVYVKDEPIEKEIRGIRIANVNGIINYEIAMGG
jgi:hypothetical protein